MTGSEFVPSIKNIVREFAYRRVKENLSQIPKGTFVSAVETI